MAVGDRSLAVDTRDITDGKKCLQIPTLRATRAMRSVLRRLVRPRIFVQSTPRSSPDHRGAFKAASNAFVAEKQALGDVGPYGVLRAFKTACTRISVRRAALY
jgi:hypothetical protein